MSTLRLVLSVLLTCVIWSLPAQVELLEVDSAFSQSDSTLNLEDEDAFDYTSRSAGFQIDSLREKYRPERLNQKAFDPLTYADATRGLDYTENPKKKEKPPKEKELKLPETGKTSFLGIGQVILIIVILVVLILLIILIIKTSGKTNPRIHDDPEWLQVDIEGEASPEQILQRKLEESLLAGNFAFAVRLLYLQTLADLHRVKLIRWKKDKTNADYVFELRQTTYHKRFRDLTRWFEKSWYSSTPPDEITYRKLEPLFNTFRSGIAEAKDRKQV